jgi:DNA-binding GntR family transcriptional regulator
MKSATAQGENEATHARPVPPTLSERAYLALADLIRRREVPSGEPLVELHLAERLGVSRTPLRQALQRLEGEGLLRKNPNRSYEVRRVDLKEYLQSLRVRQALEPEAAALAVPRVPAELIADVRRGMDAVARLDPYDILAHWRSDDEVHELFIGRCGNDVLAGILRKLRATTQLFEIERLAERMDPDLREHERILDALEQRDPDAAREAVAAHIASLHRFAIQTVA